jgi:hypothetical protein
MNLRSALQHVSGIALVLAGPVMAWVLATSAVAVPLDNQPRHPFDKLTLATPKTQQNALATYTAPDNKPVFIHGPTSITMGYITAQVGDGCGTAGTGQTFVHGPTNISMGYVAISNGTDCMYSGSTDTEEQALILETAKPQKSIALAFRARGTNAAAARAANEGGGGGNGGGGGGNGNSILTGDGTGTGSKGTPSVVPLPATLPLLVFGLAGLAATRRKKAKNDAN